MTTPRVPSAQLLAALALLSPAALAFDFHGYFRDSEGFNGQGGSQVCFQLPGSNFKARLGNECDRYLEFTFGESGKFNTVDWRVEFMPASYLPSIDSSAANSIFVQQAWLGLKFNDWGGAQLWAGRRYWKRHDVHSLDWFYWNPAQGNAAVGVEDVDLGFGKLAVSSFRVDATTSASSSNLTRGAYWVPEVRVYGVPVNAGGTLELGVDLGIAMDQGSAIGPGRAALSPLLTLQHNQADLLGGSNTIALQYGSGFMAKESGDGPGAVLAGGSSSDTQFRIIEHLVVKVDRVSGAFVLVFQDVSSPGGGGARIFSGEVRPSYHLTDWFKLQADLFYQTMSLKNAASGAGSPTLVKWTLAPTFVLGREYYSRPELRFFVTWAAWNDAAAAAGTMASGAFGSSKSGTTAGASVEIWF